MPKKATSARPKPVEAPFAVPDWPANITRLIALDEIKPYPRNPRTHPPAQITLLANLMKRHGVDQPIVVDEANVILKGHGRLRAAYEAGFKEFPVVMHKGLSISEKSAIRIADNQSALLSEWDEGLLKAEVIDLSLSGYDLPLLGFSGSELLGFTDSTEGETDADVVPEPPEHPIVRTGDLWMLGKHRLLCGDSTKGEEVSRLMGDERAVLFATDPPYAVGYSGGSHPATRANRVKANRNKHWVDDAEAGMGEAEKSDDDASEKFYRGFIEAAQAHAITVAAPWYCWHASKRQAMVERVWEDAGSFVHQQIIWVKTRAVLTYAQYMWQHEPCLFGWIRGKRPKVNRKIGGTLSTIWQVPNSEVESSEHPTSKPVRLFIVPIEQHTAAGDICYEPFSGSGTQIIAAEMTARKCYAIEISPVFAQVAIERWQNFTGKVATLDGKPFADVQRERQKKGAARAAPASVDENDQLAQ